MKTLTAAATPAVVVEKPKKKKVEMPKGEEVLVGSLVGKPLGIPVHFNQRPNPLNSWDHSPKSLPRLAIVTDITPHTDKKHNRVTYVSPKGVLGACYFPSDFPIRKLTGSIGRTIAEKYDTYAMKNMRNVMYFRASIGSDPEMFVENGQGELIPAFKFLKPKATSDRAEGGRTSRGERVYWDGFQAEFETEPNGCLEMLSDSTQRGLATLLQLAKKFDKTARISSKTVFEVPMNVLAETEEKFVEFGCMPSINSYGLEGIKVPARQVTARSAGGHMHFGIGPRSKEKMDMIVKALDAILGVSCVSLFANFDNPARRQTYGLPGEYRTPPHGLEYRTLSNAWLMHPFLMNIVFDYGRRALAFGDAGMLKHFKGDEAETIDVIRNCDVPRARAIMERNKPLLIELLKSAGGHYPEMAEHVYRIYLNGAETIIDDPNNIARNWNLEGGWSAMCHGVGKNLTGARQLILTNKKLK